MASHWPISLKALFQLLASGKTLEKKLFYSHFDLKLKVNL